MKFVEICRCCLSEECSKDLNTEYFVENQREVYGEILNDVFNIKISDTEGYKQLICEDCIGQLRNAAAFKTQVLQSERTVLSGVTQVNKIGKPKEEQDDIIYDITRDGPLDDDSGPLDDDDDWHHEDDVDIATLIKNENQKSLKIPKIEKGLKNIVKTNNTVLKTRQKKKRTRVKRETKLKSDETSKQDNVSTENYHAQTLKILKENTIKLLENSNICLFESKKIKFKCFYCKTQFLDMNDLREHTLTHKNKKYMKLRISLLKTSYRSVDLSSLHCKICLKHLNNLSDLQNHLQTHNISFSNTENLLIPFRLEYGNTCVVCSEKFNSFSTLSVHMHKHYKNNTCEVCGLSYINRISLRMHVQLRHKEKSCNICSITFPSYHLKTSHMQKNHNWSASKRYCLICNKTFKYSYNLEEHKIQEHGLVRERSTCEECGKTYLTAQNLRIHIRSVHKKERNHPCTFCGMRFFTKCDQRRHEKTHQDIRSFSCSYCEAKFKSKDSLRRHLKRQHGQLMNPQ